MIDPQSIELSALPWVSLDQRSQLPIEPCIYFAIDSQGMVQYIGKSVNPQRRWIQHHRYDELQAIGGVRIAYLFVDAPDLLLEIESALIAWFKPPLNGLRRAKRPIKLDVKSCVALEDKQLLPQEPCVYFVLDGQGAVLYIGQSENLKDRWASHHKLAAMMQLEGVRISFLKTEIELLRRVEIALIKAFNPPLNDVTAKTKGIAKLREQAGLTQRDVATSLGVDISTVRNWEYGKGVEMFVRVAKLCALFECAPADLFEEETEKND